MRITYIVTRLKEHTLFNRSAVCEDDVEIREASGDTLFCLPLSKLLSSFVGFFGIEGSSINCRGYLVSD
jgi:hypothetical protein